MTETTAKLTLLGKAQQHTGLAISVSQLQKEVNRKGNRVLLR